jgi:hypothetical protein
MPVGPTVATTPSSSWRNGGTREPGLTARNGTAYVPILRTAAGFLSTAMPIRTASKPFHFDLCERHALEARLFFRSDGAEDRLIEVCWEPGDGWGPLCRFLDRSNRSDDISGHNLWRARFLC